MVRNINRQTSREIYHFEREERHKFNVQQNETYNDPSNATPMGINSTIQRNIKIIQNQNGMLEANFKRIQIQFRHQLNGFILSNICYIF